MNLEIKQLWARVEPEGGEPEWKEVTVVSIYKASMTHSRDGESIGTEQLFALGYYPVTGELVELPLNECVIKELYEKESRNLTTFSAPVIEAGATRKENR